MRGHAEISPIVKCRLTMKTCYCCDAPAVGRGDHVPPKSFFPGGRFTSVKPIMVPACTTHNQKQSDLDEHLRFVLAASSKNTPRDVIESTVRGVTRHVKNNSKTIEKYGLRRESIDVFTDGTAPAQHASLASSLGKIARGVYYHHTHGSRKLTGPLTVHPIFLGPPEDASPAAVKQFTAMVEAFNSRSTTKMTGDFQDIFCYHIFENLELILINMLFYKDRRVLVVHHKQV